MSAPEGAESHCSLRNDCGKDCLMMPETSQKTCLALDISGMLMLRD